MNAAIDEARCRALVTFRTKYAQTVRAGEVFIADSSYAEDMKKRGNIEILPHVAGAEPSRAQAHPAAPKNKAGRPAPAPGQAPGAADEPKLPTSPIGSADGLPIGGRGKRRSSSPPGPASPPKT
jgi:hypothetical protein